MRGAAPGGPNDFVVANLSRKDCDFGFCGGGTRRSLHSVGCDMATVDCKSSCRGTVVGADPASFACRRAPSGCDFGVGAECRGTVTCRMYCAGASNAGIASLECGVTSLYSRGSGVVCPVVLRKKSSAVRVRLHAMCRPRPGYVSRFVADCRACALSGPGLILR